MNKNKMWRDIKKSLSEANFEVAAELYKEYKESGGKRVIEALEEVKKAFEEVAATEIEEDNTINNYLVEEVVFAWVYRDRKAVELIDKDRNIIRVIEFESYERMERYLHGAVCFGVEVLANFGELIDIDNYESVKKQAFEILKIYKDKNELGYETKIIDEWLFLIIKYKGKVVFRAAVCKLYSYLYKGEVNTLKAKRMAVNVFMERYLFRLRG